MPRREFFFACRLVLGGDFRRRVLGRVVVGWGLVVAYDVEEVVWGE